MYRPNGTAAILSNGLEYVQEDAETIRHPQNVVIEPVEVQSNAQEFSPTCFLP
jgi:hypothetical protein